MQYWEFFHDSVYGIQGYKDDGGRPLGEQNAPPEAREGVPFELRQCTYPDSRYKHERPMNLSGLKEVSPCWGDIINSIHLLREGYLKHSGASGLNIIHLWRLSRTMAGLPGYLTNRRDHPFRTGEIPTAVAAMYKVVLGFSLTMDSLLIQGVLAGFKLDMTVTPEMLIHVIESNGLFISPHGVCSGPMPMVREMLSTVLYGNRNGYNLPSVEALIEPANAFYEYSARDTLLHLAKYIFLVTSLNMTGSFFQRVADLAVSGVAEHKAVEELLRKAAGLATTLETTDRVQFLRNLPLQSRERLRDGLFDVMNSFPGGELQSKVVQLLQPSTPSSSVKRENALRQLVDLTMQAKLRNIDTAVVRALLEPFIKYAFTERRAMQAFMLTQAAVDNALGRESTLEPLSSPDFKRVFGAGLLDLTPELFGLSITNRPDQTIVEGERRRLIFQ
jgi:hypothetical protein